MPPRSTSVQRQTTGRVEPSHDRVWHPPVVVPLPRSPMRPAVRHALLLSIVVHGVLVVGLAFARPRDLPASEIARDPSIEIDLERTTAPDAEPAPAPPPPTPVVTAPVQPERSAHVAPTRAATILTAHENHGEPSPPANDTVVQPPPGPLPNVPVSPTPHPPINGLDLLHNLATDTQHVVDNGGFDLGPRHLEQNRDLVGREQGTPEQRALAASQGYVNHLLAQTVHMQPAGLSRYYELLVRRMREAWEPDGPERGATVEIAIEQDAHGALLGIAVVSSSRMAALDNSALAAAREALGIVRPIEMPGGRRSRWRFEQIVPQGALSSMFGGGGGGGGSGGTPATPGGILGSGMSIDGPSNVQVVRRANGSASTAQTRVQRVSDGPLGG